MRLSLTKRIAFVLTIFLQLSVFSQYRVYHSVGDTLKFYGAVLKKSKKIDQWFIIDSVYRINKVRMHSAKKYELDTVTGKFTIREKLNTPYFVGLRREGENIFYGVNGVKIAEGKRKSSRKIGLWKYWYPTGKPKMERYYQELKDPLSKVPQKSHIVNFWNVDGVQTVIDGTGLYKEITKEGTLYEGYMLEGKKDSIWRSIAKTGKKVYEERYVNGELIQGTSWDENDTEYTYKDAFVSPEFVGGRKKFVEIIRKNFKIPEFASENGIAGLMIVRFDIDTLGDVENIRMRKKLCVPCDSMAIEVVKKLKSWKPAKRRGQRIKLEYSLPLVIKYND